MQIQGRFQGMSEAYASGLHFGASPPKRGPVADKFTGAPAGDSLNLSFSGKDASVDRQLMAAIADNDLLAVQSALYDGADSQATDAAGASVIIQAIRRSETNPGASVDLISYLLQDKIVVDGPRGPVTVEKPDPNRADKAGFTPLMYAVMTDFDDPAERETVINLLLAAGADPTVPVPDAFADLTGETDAKPKTLADLARECGHDKLAERLAVEAMAFEVGDDSLRTLAEDFSAEGNKLKVSDPVLFPNLDFSETLDEEGRTLLMRLIAHDYYSETLFDFLVGEAAIGDDAERREALRSYLDEQDNAGMTALMLAAEKGGKDIVKKLLTLGADPLLLNGEGKSAAGLAGLAGHQTLADMLWQESVEARMKRGF